MEPPSLKNSSPVIKALIHRVRPAAWRYDFPTDVDIDEIFHDPGMAERARVWIADNGDPCAYAFVHFPYNNLTFEAVEPHWTDALEDEVMGWAEGVMSANYGANIKDQTLDGSCRVEDARMTRFFERHGFHRDEVETLAFEVTLTAPPGAPRLPAGFSIRPLRAEEELEEVVALHQAAFGTTNFTLADRRAVMNTSEYNPDLDLVAVAPDGTLTGNCICSVTSPPVPGGSPEGCTDPVLVRPDLQGRGLAKALVLEGLRQLFARGVRCARFGTTNLNTGMVRVAADLGFSCVAQRAWYSKALG